MAKSCKLPALRPITPTRLGPTTAPPGSVLVEWHAMHSLSNTALPAAASAANAAGVAIKVARANRWAGRITDMDSVLQVLRPIGSAVIHCCGFYQMPG